MAAALNEDYQRTLQEQKKEVHELVMAGLEQIKEGKTKDFNTVCDRLEKKYRDEAISNQYLDEKGAIFTIKNKKKIIAPSPKTCYTKTKHFNPKSTKKGAPMPTYQTLTEGLYNTAVGKSFLVKGIEYIKMNEALLMRKDTGTYYTYGIDFGKMPGF